MFDVVLSMITPKGFVDVSTPFQLCVDLSRCDDLHTVNDYANEYAKKLVQAGGLTMNGMQRQDDGTNIIVLSHPDVINPEAGFVSGEAFKPMEMMAVRIVRV